jgi:CarD family transcriptional regulator
MYQTGDYIIYGYEGVCRVCAVGHPAVPGLNKEREYYSLAPVSHNGQVYTPVDTHMVTRPVLSRQTIQTLLASLGELPILTDVPPDARAAAEYYRAILQTHDCRRCLQLYKTLLQRQRRLSESRKALTTTDLRYMKQAEDMLTGEIAFVLSRTPQEVAGCLRSGCAG